MSAKKPKKDYPPRKPHPKGGPKARRSITSQQCIARTRVCAKCTYRYKKGDPNDKCPQCGFDRRCKRAAMQGMTVCRTHGGKAALMNIREPRTYVARHLSNAYNRLITMPDLMSISHEMALLVATEDELQHKMDAAADAAQMSPMGVRHALMMLDGVLTNATVPRNRKALVEFAEEGGPVGWVHVDDFRKALTVLREALEPELVKEYFENKWRGVVQEIVRVSDVERKHIALADTLVPVQHVYEVLIAFERVTLKYIRDQEDRLNYIMDLKRAIPIDVTPRKRADD